MEIIVRTAVLYLLIVLQLRLMGRRQIGQMDVTELVVAMVLSQVAVDPMGNSESPILPVLTVMLFLTGTEIILSVLEMKSKTLHRILQGNSLILMKNGQPDLDVMRDLRYTQDDLTAALRQKDVFDTTQVKQAVMESNGTLSVQLKPEYEPPTRRDTGIREKEAKQN